MRTITLTQYFGTKKTEVKLFESIKELPAHLFNEFNKYMLQSGYIGSSMKDVNAHFHKFDLFLAKEKYGDLMTERQNLHLNFYAILNGFNLKHLGFGCFVHSIGGRKLEDHSEGNLKKTVDDLGRLGLTEGMVSDIVEDVKKNLKLN